jgi:NTE family protein
MVGTRHIDSFRELTPEVLGTKVGSLISPCPTYHHDPRPSYPPESAIAVALSGGGFRATLASVGVLQFLADARLLGRLRYVSSVSGGSIANGLLSTKWPAIEAEGFSRESLDAHVTRPLVQRVARSSMSRRMLRDLWRVVGAATRTSVLADALDRWFFRGAKLTGLPLSCRWIFNAANLTTGVRFGFERTSIGDYVLGTVKPDESIRVADAVAASAAVPGVFSAYTPKGRFPCGDGRVAKLVDGGAYENTAMEPIDDLDDAFLICCNAGGIFRTGPFGWVPIVRDLQRSTGLLYRQSTGLRMRVMVERFRAWEDATRKGVPAPRHARRGVLFALATTLDHVNPRWLELNPAPSWPEQSRLAQLKTSFARLEPRDCNKLLHLGWWLCGSSIATYHPEFLPEPWPYPAPAVAL